MKKSLPGLVLLAFAACSSSSPDGGTNNIDGGGALGDSPIVVSGNVTLSGGVTGTGTLSVTGLKGDADAFTSIAMAGLAPLPANVKTLAVAIKINGAPTAKDYLTADITGGVVIMTNDNKAYSAGAGAGTIGTLHLTAADGIDHAQNTTVYRLHGTFSATLANITGGSDTVMLSATF